MAPTVFPAPPRRPAPLPAAFLPAAFLLYALAAWACLGRLPAADALPGFGDDPDSFVWFLLWWPWAVAHGHDPLHAGIVYAPTGYGLTWATSVPTASLLALPATLLAGPVAAYGWLVLLAPACNGTALAALALELTASPAAALLAGFLFGFSGYVDAQIVGHLNLALVFPIPLLALAALRRVRSTLGRTGFVAAATPLLAAQFGLSTELFADLVLVSALALLLFAIPRTHRPYLVPLARDFGLALALTALLVSPWLLAMSRDAATIPAFINSPVTYSNDLLNLVIPTPAQRLQTAWTFHIADRFTGNLTEQDLYLGLPLVVIVFLYAAGRRAPPGRAPPGRAWRACLLAILACCVLLSLGPVAHVAGHPTVPLPALLLSRLPLLRGALPCRIAVFAALAASLVAGLWLAERRTLLRLPLALAAAAALVPGMIGHVWHAATPPCLFTPGAIRATLGPDPTVLLLPYGSGLTMLWQAQSGMRFRQSGGRLSFIPLSWQADPLTFPLFRNEDPPAAAVAAFARRHGAATVLAGPGTNPALLASLAAQPAARTVCGVLLLPVPPRGPPG